jgi:hypothetical protein
MIHGVKTIKCIWLAIWDFLKGEERYENIWDTWKANLGI